MLGGFLKDIGRIHAVQVGVAGNDGVQGFRLQGRTVHFVNGDPAQGGGLEPLVVVGFAAVIGNGGVHRVLEAGYLHEGSAGVGGLFAVGQGLGGGFQGFQQLGAGHIDHGHLVGVGQDLGQLLGAEFALRNVCAEVAAVPQGHDVAAVHGDFGIAGGDVVFLKIFVDRAGGREPAQGVRPQVA